MDFSRPLKPGTVFTTMNASGASDLSKIPLPADFMARFSTEPAPTVMVSQLQPGNGATDVASGTTIRIPFSKVMDQPEAEGAFSL